MTSDGTAATGGPAATGELVASGGPVAGGGIAAAGGAVASGGSGPTRRMLWTAALGAAAFLFTLAALLRLHVYEGVLALPLEQDRTYHLATSDGDYFDHGTLSFREGVPLVATVTLKGDPAAGNGDTAVWTEFTSLADARGNRIDYHERRTAFDRRTAMTVNCCGEYVDEDAQARQSGLAFRLPFRAEPRSYPMYDTVLRRAVTLRFEGEGDVQGIRAHRYGYTVGPIKIEDVPGSLPGRALGLPGRPALGVSRYAEVTRTLWVEPESGLTVKTMESHRQTLRTVDGVERAVSLRADLVMSPEDVAAEVAAARAFTRWALLVRDVLPGAFCLLGAVLLLVAVRLRRPVPPSAAAQDEQQVPAHDLA
ncbi:DUF3068 domain-containing protein [Planomonospora sp. ID91781]|uniref:DUF3068 domain-containing protein n=1 Tax=Planomonospora sp. ID91781 TaxID=2738135 RepID=UPI0018C3A745|nr:DUF3068 domain-containing protein [Planomonospora sp. ID91781]MBG0821036.1 DUF3068 domain-containing protein [Planomonospora sp. ID91781]